MISIEEAIAFIRKFNLLKEWKDEEIHAEISKAIAEESLVFSTDKDGKLNGICFGERNDKEKKLHIKCIIAPGQLDMFVHAFRVYFRGYTLTAFRRGVFKHIKI